MTSQKPEFLLRLVKNWYYPNLFRQTPDLCGCWNGIQFSEDPVSECDGVIVLNFSPETFSVHCPPQNIWAFVQEPFIPDTFGWLVKGQEQFRKIFTPHALAADQKHIPSQTCLPWWVNKNYDELISMKVPDKIKLISCIYSSKRGFPGQKLRFSFCEKLKAEKSLPFGIDFFGKNSNPIEDKWNGLAGYQYSLAIENSSTPHYWTEKIADCFLSFTLPFYWGCTNMEQYFPAGSFIRIDIEDYEASLQIIKDVIKNEVWRDRIKFIREARDLVLHKYQFFPFIAARFTRKKLPRETVVLNRFEQ